jgi:hypothetical protein
MASAKAASLILIGLLSPARLDCLFSSSASATEAFDSNLVKVEPITLSS